MNTSIKERSELHVTIINVMKEYQFFKQFIADVAYAIGLNNNSLADTRTVSSMSCHNMSRIMRKPDFFICENKGADQLCSNCTADLRLCFRI